MTDDSPGPSQPSKEQMVKSALHYATQGEFGKAWAAFSPSAPDDRGVVRGMRLADFVAHPSARHADLTEAHVVALRLYTTQAL